MLFHCRAGLLSPSDPNNIFVVNKLCKGGKQLTGVREAKYGGKNVLWSELITVLFPWVNEQHVAGDVPPFRCV